MRRTRRDPWLAAVEHLKAVDVRWAEGIARVGPCALRPRKEHFATLVRAIIGQQISTKAAASIDARVRELAGGPHEPAMLLALGETSLRGAGLSGVKARYVLNLAEAVEGGSLPLARLRRMEDEEVIRRLTAVKGIGRWTAEMFLIFSLNRPDVLPVGDLGVRVGLRNHYALEETPTPAQCVPLAEPWRPYRTVAMWYLWRLLDKTPKATT